MMDMTEMMDDELGLEDSSDLVKAFIDYAAKRYENFDFAIRSEPAQSVINERQVPGGRLCFVITKNRTSSWVEDLSEMVSLEERTRIYN